MSKRRRVIGSNAEAKTDAGPDSNADVELDSELQGDSEEGRARVPQDPHTGRVARGSSVPSVDDISEYLQKTLGSRDTIGTVAELEKRYQNLHDAKKSIFNLIENQHESEAQQKLTPFLADDTLNSLGTRFPSLDVEHVRRERDTYLGPSNQFTNDTLRMRLSWLINIIDQKLVHPLRSIHSEFKEVLGTLKAMSAFANKTCYKTKLQSTIDDQAPTDEHFRDMMRGVHIDSPPNT